MTAGQWAFVAIVAIAAFSFSAWLTWQDHRDRKRFDAEVDQALTLAAERRPEYAARVNRNKDRSLPGKARRRARREVES